MSKLLFLWRVTLICNLCYLVALGLRIFPSGNYGAFQSTVIVMGTIMALWLNVFSAISVLILGIQKNRRALQPAWLLITNLVIFLAQFLDLFI